jgi:hypothetical protein
MLLYNITIVSFFNFSNFSPVFLSKTNKILHLLRANMAICEGSWPTTRASSRPSRPTSWKAMRPRPADVTTLTKMIDVWSLMIYGLIIYIYIKIIYIIYNYTYIWYAYHICILCMMKWKDEICTPFLRHHWTGQKELRPMGIPCKSHGDPIRPSGS